MNKAKERRMEARKRRLAAVAALGAKSTAAASDRSSEKLGVAQNRIEQKELRPMKQGRRTASKDTKGKER